ncbi:carboxypeptidase M32 [Deinococcus psychrotolerans]|uniref:Metal-dependent carboxypeptidase n=1 Tax=Deinococcus psychrotolerans TaxID=2489213 RepID=A0A3G8YBZ6_9DEIO|nr:carboxypeptidase M32 [Deinococcus psychrotolerans]AZI42525.1 carboxypeptidase M32 [Deinococcus psychrotolerans]
MTVTAPQQVAPAGPLDALKRRLNLISDLGAAQGLLSWDQETQMPEDAARVRGLQMSSLAGLSHHLLTSDETRALLEAAEAVDTGQLSEVDVDLLRVTRRDFDKATKLPTAFVEDVSQARNEAHHAWIKARADNDFASFAPYLERVLSLTRQYAELIGYDQHPYDALLDDYEPGMKTAHVRQIFADLRERTLPLLRSIVAAGDATDYGVLTRSFPAAAQRQLSLKVAEEAFGLLPSFSRLDESAHPFQTNFSADDIRITTRFDEHYFPMSLFGTWHETGHAMYEHGVSSELERTPLARGASLGVHESQSRLFENLLGRSKAFWQHYFAELAQAAPEVAAGQSAESIYRAVNRVEPSLIRVEADEVTYNFHIMLRFELELALIEGELSVADLPDAWNAKMQEYLGVVPDSDSEGVLQDIHWSAGLIGYFPTYSLGNLLSVQLLEAASQNPEIAAGLQNADYAPLREWLRVNVHQYGRRHTPAQIVEGATGQPLSADAYVKYLFEKYAEIYGL